MQVHKVPLEVWHEEAEGRLLADLCIPLLRKAERYFNHRYKAEDLIVDCVRGELDAWIAVEDDEVVMCCITKVIEYPRTNSFAFASLGGKPGTMEDWLPVLLVEACGYCAVNDIDTMEVPAGRKGWTRILSKYGFTSKLVMFEADRCQVFSAARKAVSPRS